MRRGWKERASRGERKARRYVYIGETNRSVYERGLEHVNDIASCKTSSHMLRHLIDVHEEEEDSWEEIRFGMKILKSTRTAMERQILESVLIQKARESNIMNNKAEYNRCAIPRLTAKLGERDLEKWREEDKQEVAKEASIEEKIRQRKKEKAKKRGTANRRMEPGQPKRKRRKVEGGEEDSNHHQEAEEEVRELRTISIRSPPKRKKEIEKREGRSPKKARKNQDMRRYITCKRWKEDE